MKIKTDYNSCESKGNAFTIDSVSDTFERYPVVFRTIAIMLAILRNWLTNWHHRWKLKSPIEKWQSLYKIGGFGFKMCGINLLTDNKVTWITLCWNIQFLLYYISVIITFIQCVLQGKSIHSFRPFVGTGVVIAVSRIQLFNLI